MAEVKMPGEGLPGNSIKKQMEEKKEEEQTTEGKERQPTEEIEPVKKVAAKSIASTGEKEKEDSNPFLTAATNVLYNAWVSTWNDYLFPTIKDAIAKGVSTMINNIVYPDKKPEQTGNKTDYTKYSSSPATTGRSYDYSGRSTRDYSTGSKQDVNRRVQSLEFNSWDDAQYVLDCANDRFEDQGYLSVLDLYDFCDMHGEPRYTDRDWGWTNIDRVEIHNTYDGARLEFPKVRYIGDLFNEDGKVTIL